MDQESDIFDLQEDAYGSQDFDEIIEQMSYENGQTSSEGTSGKFEVATLLVDSLMNSTKEKIVIVSYSTKVCATQMRQKDIFMIISCVLDVGPFGRNVLQAGLSFSKIRWKHSNKC